MDRLGEADHKLRYRNKRFIAILQVSSALVLWIFLPNQFSAEPLLTDLLAKEATLPHTSPILSKFCDLTSRILKDGSFFFVLCAYIIFYSLASPLFATSVIHTSKRMHPNASVSFKVLQSFTKPLITSFYITLCVLGCMSLLLLILFPLALFNASPFALRAMTSTLSILATCSVSYLAVVWNLSLVVSILEEEHYGVQALRRAAMVVEGIRFRGFAFNLNWTLLNGMFLHGWLRSESMLLSGLNLLNIFLFTSLLHNVYAFLYLESKKTHGEQMELVGNLGEFAKISDDPLTTAEDIP